MPSRLDNISLLLIDTTHTYMYIYVSNLLPNTSSFHLAIRFVNDCNCIQAWLFIVAANLNHGLASCKHDSATPPSVFPPSPWYLIRNAASKKKKKKAQIRRWNPS